MGELAGCERANWAHFIPARLEGTSWSKWQSCRPAWLSGSDSQTVPDSSLSLLGTQGGMRPSSCSYGLRSEGEGRANRHPNTVSWGGNSGSWGAVRAWQTDLTQPGWPGKLPGGGIPDLDLCRPYTGQMVCSSHGELKIEKDTKS